MKERQVDSAGGCIFGLSSVWDLHLRVSEGGSPIKGGSLLPAAPAPPGFGVSYMNSLARGPIHWAVCLSWDGSLQVLPAVDC